MMHLSKHAFANVNRRARLSVGLSIVAILALNLVGWGAVGLALQVGGIFG